MTACIVTIADTEQLARALNRYIRCSLRNTVESYFMTYDCNLLSGALLQKTDLLLLELLRRDDMGYRAEALFAAEKWLQTGKRVMIVSGNTISGKLNVPFYWDLDSPISLSDCLQYTLAAPIPTASDLQKLMVAFATYCRPANSHHNS